ncbi:MAG: T9SS C-terminal target domain-containing protein [Chitinophagia bacterium]|nr:T9SS C-terminal target domain-containing protein [Chitinophagia bacterium]
MKKIAAACLFSLLSTLLVNRSFAQCDSGRYLYAPLFSTVKKDTVVFSHRYNLQMNVYSPIADTFAHRPLVILAHDGSFTSGDKDSDSTVIWLCRNLAKRGYVTASVNYRLGDYLSMTADSNYAASVIAKAMSDGKAAIRYFVHDAANANTYKIDTNNIFVGGNGSGAVLYMHVGYIDTLSECSSLLRSAMLNNGGFEGNSSDSGYTYNKVRTKAIINLAGALNNTDLISPSKPPIVSAQGDGDVTIPYRCAFPISGTVRFPLCGLNAIEDRLLITRQYHFTKIFYGDTHTPWASNTAKFYSVDSMVTKFLYNMVCTHLAGIEPIKVEESRALLFPNPAHDNVVIQTPFRMNHVEIYNYMGKRVFTAADVFNYELRIDLSDLPVGMYYAKVYADKNIAPILTQFAIQ